MTCPKCRDTGTYIVFNEPSPNPNERHLNQTAYLCKCPAGRRLTSLHAAEEMTRFNTVKSRS